MKTCRVIAGERAEHQQTFGHAFAQGLRRHGWDAEVVPRYVPCDLAVMWGVRRRAEMDLQRGRGGEICILERGYVGDRFRWSSVSFGGGLNGRGEFRGPDDASRWETHFAGLAKPWRAKPDGYALILEQVPGDAAVANVDLPAFYSRAENAFAPMMAVRRRRHPNVSPANGMAAIAKARTSLDEDLAGAAVAITWNSNSGVDAVLAGVPAIAMDIGSMAWPVTGHELGVLPPMPDRTAWMHRLAWCQWTREEMESGACWDAVGRQEVSA